MASKVFPILEISRVVKDVQDRIKKNSDACICISGAEGIGKSSFGMEFSYLLDSDFNLWDNILYSPNENELLEKIEVCKKGSVLNLDEAVKVLEKQDWHNQTFIKKTFQVIRGKNLITLLLIPRLEDLNQYFRAWRVMLNICVIYRGWAYLQVPDVYNKGDVWHTKFNQSIMDRALDGETFQTADVGKVLLAISQYKGFIGFINFPKMPVEVERAYVKLKDRFSLFNLRRDNENSKDALAAKKKSDREIRDKRSLALSNAIKDYISNGMSLRKIAKKLGTTLNIVQALYK